MEFMPYSEMLYLMEKEEPFSFSCSTAKGKFLKVRKAMVSVVFNNGKGARDKGIASSRSIGIRNDGTGGGKEKKMWINVVNLDKAEEDPRRILKIYPRCIIQFNGFKVSPEL